MLRVVTLSTLFPDATRPNFGVFVERQAAALAALPDVRVTVIAGVGLPPGPLGLAGRHRALAALPGRERWRGLDVHRPRFAAMPFTAGRRHAAMLARAVVPVLDALAAGPGFDVLDAGFFFPDGVAAAALGRRYGVPVSIKARGADVHFWGRRPATAAQVLDAGRAADGVLAVSAAMARDLDALGIAGARVHHTGVEADRFRPLAPAGRAAARARLGTDGPLVAAVGALIPRKGHDLLIRAVAALPGVALRIAGEGPERARLEALAAALGVGGRVRLLGPVPHAALPELYAAADVSALASSSEGLANAWVESIACGTPVVTTAAGGAAEAIDRPAAGRIVARTPAAFAAALAELIAHPPPREAVRAAAARFSWEANAAALRAHLEALVRGYRRPRAGSPTPRQAAA